ncbi:DUF2513 domain-containing protein [Pseudomonas tohonis]|uniref:DUF2513 domain-containing protein n=1 Tax=Pseudomonas tohonis TaxID=2725477 RepID=UPI0022EFFA16|nr:DUF2513 domain-containing protein [Pseudomonas tohonis]
MNRKDDFVYVILLLIERAEVALSEQDLLDQMEVIQSRRFDREGLSLDSVVHHVSILEDAGFIKVYVPRGFAREVTRLTWDGHEYLASLKRLYGGSPLEG